MTETKELRKLDPKTARVKAWMPLITALISLAGVITVAILQFGAARESSVKTIVEQLNDKVIPNLQQGFNDLSDTNNKIVDKVSEQQARIARLEGILEILLRDKYGARRKPPELKPLLTKPAPLDKTDEKKEKIEIPKINIQQQALTPPKELFKK